MKPITRGIDIVWGNGDETICKVASQIELPADVTAVKLKFRPAAAAVAIVRTAGKLVQHYIQRDGDKYVLGPVIAANVKPA